MWSISQSILIKTQLTQPTLYFFNFLKIHLKGTIYHKVKITLR